MEIVTKVVIDGCVVSEVFRKNDIIVYELDSNDDANTMLYFVKGSKVIFTQEISADCGQNTGYISGVSFNGVN
jgi:hypothetical protein